jgi:hypothetical protein
LAFLQPLLPLNLRDALHRRTVRVLHLDAIRAPAGAEGPIAALRDDAWEHARELAIQAVSGTLYYSVGGERFAVDASLIVVDANLAAAKLPPNDNLLDRIDTVDLKHVLGDLQTDRGNLHVDGSPM